MPQCPVCSSFCWDWASGSRGGGVLPLNRSCGRIPPPYQRMKIAPAAAINTLQAMTHRIRRICSPMEFSSVYWPFGLALDRHADDPFQPRQACLVLAHRPVVLFLKIEERQTVIQKGEKIDLAHLI